jgi:hypothetical protein
MKAPESYFRGYFYTKPFDNHYPLLIIGLVRDLRKVQNWLQFTLNSFDL